MALELKVPQRPLGQSQNLHILPLVTLSLCLLEIALCDMTGSSSVLFGIEKSKLMESGAKKADEGAKSRRRAPLYKVQSWPPQDGQGLELDPLSS